MKHTVSIEEWLALRRGAEVIELPNSSIQSQLTKYDEAGTGLGFVMVLSLVMEDDGVNPAQGSADLLPVPVVKLNKQWMTIEDENLADILSGVIRMVAPN